MVMFGVLACVGTLGSAFSLSRGHEVSLLRQMYSGNVAYWLLWVAGAIGVLYSLLGVFVYRGYVSAVRGAVSFGATVICSLLLYDVLFAVFVWFEPLVLSVITLRLWSNRPGVNPMPEDDAVQQS